MLKKTVFYVILSISALLFAYPFIWMLFATLKPEAELASLVLTPSRFSIESYRTVFEKIPIIRAFFNSLLVTATVTISVNIIGGIAGYALSQFQFKGKKTIMGMILFSMMVPFHIILIPLYVLIVKLNLTDSYAGLILPAMVSTFAILMYKQFFAQIPKALIDAARIDGCSELGIVFRVLFPLSKPVVITVSIITFMGVWNDVLWPLIVIRDKALMTMPQMVTLFTTGGEAQTLGPKLASAFMLAFPIILIYVFFQRYFINSMVHSGMK